MQAKNNVTVQDQRAPLLKPGETCWKLAQASRVAILLDNAAYFAAAKTALLQARQSITLIGWAFDPRVRLEPETAQPSQVDEIGALLNALIDERPELDIRVLIWNAALPLKYAKQGYPKRARRELD